MDCGHLSPNVASNAVIVCAIEVHSALGAGMLERAIGACMLYEMAERGLHVEHQVRLPVTYKQVVLPFAYRVDFIVEKCLLVELKCVERILPVHEAQLLTYLKLTGLKLGLLLNVNVAHMREGIRRIINGSAAEL
jgi:GxxExxY protein